MPISDNSLANAVAAGIKNESFGVSAEVIPRKQLLIGTYDPLKLTVVNDTLDPITSSADAASKYGFGFMLHRMAVAAEAGNQGLEMWVIPQSEIGGAVGATGTITFSGTATESGTLYLYIADIAVQVTIASGDDETAVAAAVAAAVTLNDDLPVTAGSALGVVTLTSKTLGPWGNDIAITFNQGLGENDVAGVSAVVVDMASGAGIPDIQDAVDALGTGDDANEDGFTDVNHGYGQDSTTLDVVSLYVGEGDTETGLYDPLVARPFRALGGDTVADTAGYTALIAIGDGRKNDRANGIIAAPGASIHPTELACMALGIAARLNNQLAETSYTDQILPGVWTGEKADRWTKEFAQRDTAVKSGISPTRAKNGSLVMQNLVSFYHPDSVPVNSNGYRSMRNISIIQNMLAAEIANFEADKWKGISIVADLTKITNESSAEKAKDIDSVKGDLSQLADAFEGNAWIYSADFTKEKLAEADAVTVRAGGTGFNNKLKVIFSGEGGILNTQTFFDTNISVLTA